MDELIIDGKTYVPSRRAAEITGYAKDYIGQLCREGRVEAKLVGRSWYVLETSLREHRFGSEASITPSEEMASSSPDATAEPEPTKTWERPSYTAEEVPEIVPLNNPNYLENTGHNEETAQEEVPVTPSVESAWEDWYVKSGRPEEEVQEAQEPLSDAEPEEATQVLEEETSIPIRTIPGSMDIAVAPHSEQAEVQMPPAAVYEPRKATRRARRPFGPRIYKAFFVAYVILVVAVVVIGAGLLEAAPENPITDFIAGISRLESK